METLRDSRPGRVIRTAAWFYVAPRMATVFLILAVLGFAGLLLFLQMVLNLLHGLGG